MSLLYLSIKLIHVLSAIIAVGFNISYGFLLLKANKDKEHLLFTLKSIKFLDDYIANPCYFLALFTGFYMNYILMGSIKPYSWNLYALILFSIMGIIAFFFYTPYLSKQIKLLEEKKYNTTEYTILENKQRYIGIILTILVFIIVFLMVFKPNI